MLCLSDQLHVGERITGDLHKSLITGVKMIGWINVQTTQNNKEVKSD